MNRLCKVLIVDDEFLVRQGIKHHMNWEAEGFQIVGEASNGEEGLEQVQSLQPDIVITDIVMPVMDGETFVRTLKASHPQIEVIVLSSFSEFEYVRSTLQNGAADYILKPKLDTNELLQVLQRTAGKIPELQFEPSHDGWRLGQLMEKMLSGFTLDEENEMHMIRETFPHRCFRLLVYKPQETHTYVHKLDKEHLESRLRDQLPDVECAIVPAEGTSPVVLLNVEPSKDEWMVQRIKELANENKDGQGGLCWVLSDSFSSFEEMGNVYRTRLIKLMEYRFYYEDRSILVYGELPPLHPAGYQFNVNMFLQHVKRNRTEAAREYLQEHALTLGRDYIADVFEIKSFLGNLIFNVTITLADMDVQSAALEESKYAYFKHVDGASSLTEAMSVLDQFMAEVQECTSGEGGRRSDPNMKMLLEYMHEHFDQPLGLAEVAKHFHFNPSYLSSYFSSHKKEGFNEYLNKIRIEKAEELLRSDHVTISEISSMVGYSDHSYFCKVFKKFTGLSPSRYRRKFWA
ncbi:MULTISPECIES: response regulator transcription factor [Paenibacillus]|uniref:Two-component system response regulator YesN n=1 Tax=Paenibacillus pabuli TaxID=1472 RepID=A0A855Y8X1_9BACL|nr:MULTISPECIES: response regulator transcription factor [Paenibacillus]PWW39705.1 two-component system response regulator YesN [Paenibacillus pabuli]PXW06829.1 two-component system response regulator YesN [Paenibacillus taichungensis]